MDPITPKIQTNQIINKGRGKKNPEAKSSNTDRVDISSGEKKHGFIGGTLKAAAQIGGGVVGTFVGAAKGTIQGGASEEVKAPSNKIIQTSRAVLATAGVTAGIISCATLGPAGLVLGPIVGGVIGSAVGGSLSGLVDGAWAGLKGAGKGSLQGMKTGIDKTGRAMDWILSKSGGSYSTVRNSNVK